MKNQIEKLFEQIQLEEKPLSFSEAAEYLDVSKSHLYKMTSTAKIPHFKPNGKMIYFKKSDLNNYLFRNRIASGMELEQKAIDYVTLNSKVVK